MAIYRREGGRSPPSVVYERADELRELPAGLVVAAGRLLHQDADDVFLRVGEILGVEVAAPVEGACAADAALALAPLVHHAEGQAEVRIRAEQLDGDLLAPHQARGG